MKGRRPRGTVAVLAGALLSLPALSRAQTSPPPEAASAPDPKLEEAKRLFREGNALRKAGDCQRAAEKYLESRAIVPSAPNTTNAAYCLGEIGRHDEALELYEELLAKFSDQLTDTDRQQMAPTMAALRKKIGSLEVSANARGTLVVDGRTRGQLPLRFPVRVLPGKRVVRVIADGWKTFEQTVVVTAGESTKLDAKLEPLAGAGRLRVEGSAIAGADLFIDGARVGQVPWEGTLSPGEHLYWLRKGEQGSAPRAAVVVQGQTVLVSVELEKLGPGFRIALEPPTASLWIDGVAVGKGAWAGALPVGTHTLEAREEGYRKGTVSIDESVPARLDLKLQVDPDHPRWGTGKKASISLEIFGGGALGSSLGSAAEQACKDNRCNQDKMVLGFMTGARAGYELPLGLGFELGGGYMRLVTSLEREVRDDSPGVDATFTLDDDITMAGPFALGGATYRISLGSFQLTPAVDVGLLFASTRDRISGTATDGTRTVDVTVFGSGSAVRSAALFVLPELRADARFGPYYVGLGLGALFFVLDGPANHTGEMEVLSSCGTGVECAGNSSAIKAERAYGPAILFESTLRVGRRF